MPRTRGNWVIWATVAAIIGGGVVLLSQNAVEVPTSAPRQLLPTPEEVTTSTTLEGLTVGVMSEKRFPLTRAGEVNDFSDLIGPVQFAGKYWIAGNSDYPSSESPILSSNDGLSWEVVGHVSVGEDGWLRIDDFDTFGGVLVAVGSAGRTRGPEYAPPTSAQSVIWKSTDGRRWSSIPILRDEGSMTLEITPGSDEILVTLSQSSAFDRSTLGLIPPELVGGLERGDLDLWPDPYGFRVVAPPGIELFRFRSDEAYPAGGFVRLFRSENLIIWEEIDVDFSVWNLAATPDGGFLSNDNALRYSSDGRSWERTDRFPPLYYQDWGDRLVGLEHSSGTTRLVVVDEEGSATIELPNAITDGATPVAQFPRLEIRAGAGGIAAIVQSEAPGYVEPITRSGGYILAMDNGVLRVEEPSGESGYAQFDIEGFIPGTYLEESNSIRFETNEGRHLEFPVAAFLDLRATPQRSRFDVWLSADGVTWARPQTGFRAGHVEIIGYIDHGFLVGIHNFSSVSGELPVTVYKAGPVG